MAQSTPENRELAPRKGFDLTSVAMWLSLILFAAMSFGLVMQKRAQPTHDEVQEQCLASGGEVVMSEGLFGPSYGCRGADGKITRMESRG